MTENELSAAQCAFGIACSFGSFTDSKEHIILNALGGRKTVQGFICKACNDYTGAQWDNELAKQLNPFSLLLKITRERGVTPREKFLTISGERIILNHDGSLEKADNYFNKRQIDGKTEITFSGKSNKEINKKLLELKKKYPQIDLNTVLINEKISAVDPLHIQFTFGSGNASKSIIKSALALAIKSGVNINLCSKALNYLKGSNSQRCHGLYYDTDIIINRPQDQIFHSVAISGNPQTGLLLAYVEFFSSLRTVVCLSDEYIGPNIKNIYSIDPLLGQEIDLDFEILLIKSDMEEIYNLKKCSSSKIEEAIDLPIKIARQKDLKREIERINTEAINYAFEQLKLHGYTQLSFDNIGIFTDYLIEKIKPFLSKKV